MIEVIGKTPKLCVMAFALLLGLLATQTIALASVTQGATAQVRAAYRLDTGDKVQVTVYGEDDLSGQFDVDGSGNVRLPLIGQVHAAGLTLHQLELAVTAKLKAGYLINPKVSAEVAVYRPFTILGEVNKPGEYPYESGMNVLNAVALGGGYTYRADKDDVYIRRKDSMQEVELPATVNTLVFPGDTVRVDERIF
jgi:protein involved in polysaccharide export with SLBB domain